MRRQKSFLLTVIPAEEPQNNFCGQVKSVSTGKSFTFSNMDEFRAWLMDELAADSRENYQQDLISTQTMASAIKPA